MKSTFYTIIYLYLFVFGSLLTGYSIPANRKPIQVTQPDGTKLTIFLKGDEFLHFAQTADGYDLKQNSKGYYTYASRDSLGRLVSGDLVARNAEDRTISETAFLKTVNKNVTFSGTVLNKALQKRISSAQKIGLTLRSNSTIPSGLLTDYPRVGSPKSLVILVNFSDVSFKPEDTNTEFNNMLNQVGYHKNNHVGSVRDYFSYNSGGKFSPDFVLVGPVTLSKPYAYYGANDADGNDVNPAQMVYEACQKAASSVNFADFDADNDGTIDNVYIYYAGKGEADGGNDNTIWPHSWSLSEAGLSLTLNNKKINAYACSGELNGSTDQMTGMGTFTHEYSHILGLPDMYDVDYEKYNGEAFDLNSWSLMAYGAYNNNSSTPPCFTLPERSLLGWATPVMLDSAQDVTLSDFGSSNVGYRINTSNEYEYYLVENRQLTQNIWDAYLPYHGMLVYHMDLRPDAQIKLSNWGTQATFSMSDLWKKNLVNSIATHQCCDIEEADNERILYNKTNYIDYLNSIKADPYPGTSNVKQLTDFTAPSMRTWDGAYLGKSLTNISEANNVVHFKFMDLTSFKKSPNVLPAKSIGPYSFNAAWNAVVNATGYYLDVYTQDTSFTPPLKKYLNGFQNFFVTDTTATINVPNDLTTYYYSVKATNNNGVNAIYTPTSDRISLTTTDGTPISLAASLIDNYTFRANWQKSNYATGYYLDVFSIDSNTGDTIWLKGYNNYYLTKNYLILGDLDDQTTYFYAVRGTNGLVTSRNSRLVTAKTSKATEILAYSKDRIIYLKGIDKGSEVLVYLANGTLIASAHSNNIAVYRPGTYLISATLDGKVKHLKLAVQ